MLIPACDFESEILYNNILIEKSERNLLSDFTNTLLPKGELGMDSPEPRQHFILNNINQCFDKKDIEKFMLGLKNTQQYIQETYKNRFLNLSKEEKTSFFNYISGGEAGEEIKYFTSTIKELAIKHFTSSEKFMTEQMDFEMVPSRYLGCKEI